MTIIYGLIVLGFIVFVHEMGHFAAAKLCGVKVEAFSVGMGPVIAHKTLCKIDWRLSALPLGGYCAMKGEQDFINAYEEGLQSVTGDKDSLYGVHPLKRGIIAFAGPFSNLLLTFFSFFLISLIGYTYYSPSAKIQLADEVYPEIYSAARQGGLLTGDTIKKINETQIEDFSEIFSVVSLHPDEDLIIQAERDGSLLEFTVHTIMDKSTGAGKLGVLSVEKSEKREAKRYNFFDSIIHGAKETFSMLVATLKGIQSLFKGVKVTEAVSGPARITTMLGDTVKTGFSAGFRTGLSSVLNFIALISISLFLMNLLPIPILDGGLILFSLIESIFRIHISPKVRYSVQYIGLAFIIFMFVIALIGDFNYFMRLFNEK